MKIDVGLRGADLRTLGSEAAAYERLGVDGLWSYETAHDPFLPLFAAALATERPSLGTAIAVAFARTPFAMAQTAWDLQRVSGGRLLLGLGTQVRAHVERRFSAAFEHPAARIVDYIRCLRAIWDTFQNGARPAYEGRFYRFTLISDFFNPGPIEHPEIPISLAGVGERMARAAGEVADGFHVHPLHSPGYVRDVVRPRSPKAPRRRTQPRAGGSDRLGVHHHRRDRDRARRRRERRAPADRLLRVDADLPPVSGVSRLSRRSAKS